MCKSSRVELKYVTFFACATVAVVAIRIFIGRTYYLHCTHYGANFPCIGKRYYVESRERLPIGYYLSLSLSLLPRLYEAVPECAPNHMAKSFHTLSMCANYCAKVFFPPRKAKLISCVHKNGGKTARIGLEYRAKAIN